MPTNNNKAQQPTRPTLSRKEIEEIAREAARHEVQRLFGELETHETVSLEEARSILDIPPAPPGQDRPGDSLHLYIDPTAPPLVPTPQNTVATNLVMVQATERRFTAHLPHIEGKDSQVTGTRNYATGHVVLDDAKGVYGSWEAFLKAYHEQGQTPTEIVMEAVAG